MNESHLPAQTRLPSRRQEQGSAIIVVVMTVAVLLIIAGTLMSYTNAKQAAPFQASSWHEAGTAAEGGVEIALNALRRSIDEGTTAWEGWNPNPDVTDAPFAKKYFTEADLLSHGGEGNTTVRAIVEVSRPSGANTVNPVGTMSLKQAYVIRSTGIANVPGAARIPLSKPDQALRKLNFFPDAKAKAKVENGLPQVARVIEAIATPVTPFPLAIHAKEQIDMKAGAVAVPATPPSPLLSASLNSETMRVDSYEPSIAPVTALPSNDDRWKTKYMPVLRNNGSIATNGKKKDIIRLEKVAVLGNIAKGGGTINMKTPGAVISGEVVDGFYKEMKSVPYPGTRTPAFSPIEISSGGNKANRPNGSTGEPKIIILEAGRGPTGSEPNPPPKYYKFDKIHLHDGEKIVIKKDSNPGGVAEIWVTGDIVLHKGGTIELEDTAKAIFYCEKNVTMEEKDEGKPAIKNWASKTAGSYTAPDPSALQFYGVLPRNQKPKKKKFKLKGNFIGLVYAPDHEFEIKLKKGGNRAVWGSFAGRKFKIEAGTRFHYDESLADVGKPYDYTLQTWQEDWYDPSVRPTP